MGRKARREREREEMKRIIAEAAVQLIITEGYEGLSIRKIAALIDYSPTTIYNYYTDKAAIITYMVEQIYHQTVADCKKVIEENQELPVDQVFLLSIQTYLYSIVRQPEMGKAVILSGFALFSQQNGTESTEESGRALMLHHLKEGEQLGIFRKLDEHTADIILTSLLGFALSAIENQLYKTEQYGHLVAVFSDMILRSILNYDQVNSI